MTTSFTITAPAASLAALLRGVPVGAAAKVSPIYGSALVSVEAGEVRVTTTDSVITMTRTAADLDVIDGTGSVALPRAKVEPLLDRFEKSAPATLSVTGTDAVLSCGRARYAIRCLDAADFPPLDPFAGRTGVEGEVQADEFVAALQRVRISAAREPVRAHLGGVSMTPRPDGRAVFAALDGKMISVTSVRDVPVCTTGLTIPLSTIDVIASATTGLVTIETDPAFIRVRGQGVTLVSAVIDGDYPDYVPLCESTRASIVATLKVDRAGLLAAIDRLAIVSEEVGGGLHQLRLSTAGGELVITTGGQQSDGDEHLDCEIDGPDVKVILQPKMLRKIIAAASSDTVTIGVTSNSPAGIMHTDGVTRDIITGMRG